MFCIVFLNSSNFKTLSNDSAISLIKLVHQYIYSSSASNARISLIAWVVLIEPNTLLIVSIESNVPSNLFDKNCLSSSFNIFESLVNVFKVSSINANSIVNNVTLIFDLTKDIIDGIDSLISFILSNISFVKSVKSIIALRSSLEPKLAVIDLKNSVMSSVIKSLRISILDDANLIFFLSISPIEINESIIPFVFSSTSNPLF